MSAPDVAALLARVERYDDCLGSSPECDCEMVASTTGEWVRFSDFDALATALRAALAECKRAEVGEDMASGCLVMIREDLEAMVGEDKMIGVPPMMYNDVIRTIYAQKEAALADQRRWQYFMRSALGAPSFAITLTLCPNVETWYAAIDAAMTADGGSV